MGRSGVPLRTRMRSPSFRAKNFSTCKGSPTARGSPHASLYVMGRCCLLVSELDRHLEIGPVSQLYTWPVVSPVNASRRPSRDAMHHLGSGRLAIPCQQNWRPQLWVDRGPTSVGVMRRKLDAHRREIENCRNPPNLMVVRHYGLEVERIEQLTLLTLAPPHHRNSPSMAASPRRNHGSLCSSR